MDIEKSLAGLERQIRRIRLIGGFSLLIVAGLLLTGWAVLEKNSEKIDELIKRDSQDSSSARDNENTFVYYWDDPRTDPWKWSTINRKIVCTFIEPDSHTYE